MAFQVCRKYIFGLSLALLLTLSFLTMPTPGWVHQEEGHICFFAIDRNGDKKVSKEELRAAYPKINDRVFARIDVDQDGWISHEEYEAAVDKGVRFD